MIVMKVIYANNKVMKVCCDMKQAQKLFGGNKKLSVKLQARIWQLEAAENLSNIFNMPTLHFHHLKDCGKNKYAGCWAIDIDGRKSPWRLILRPVDDEGKYVKGDMLHQSKYIQVVEIREVSKHYE